MTDDELEAYWAECAELGRFEPVTSSVAAPAATSDAS